MRTHVRFVLIQTMKPTPTMLDVTMPTYRPHARNLMNEITQRFARKKGTAKVNSSSDLRYSRWQFALQNSSKLWKSSCIAEASCSGLRPRYFLSSPTMTNAAVTMDSTVAVTTTAVQQASSSTTPHGSVSGMLSSTYAAWRGVAGCTSR